MTGKKGGEVTLPCTGPNVPLSDQDLTFMWRFKGRVTVYNFVNGKHDLSKQGNQFKDRTSLFVPQEGNFSLRLTDLTENDSGPYTCFVPKAEEADIQTQHVSLTIRGLLSIFMLKCGVL